MKYFLDTVETIPKGVGFAMFGPVHTAWMAVFVLVCVVCCKLYKKAQPARRTKAARLLAILIIADEIFKVAMLVYGGRYLVKYLPLHLCSVNIFIIAFHAWKPNKTRGNFLYTVCIPGAIAALLFPSWVKLPFANFMHLHSFTIHIMLALYPIMLTYGGDIRPDKKYIPGCLASLAALAVPAALVNHFCGTNFMFLSRAGGDNPLKIFADIFGTHLVGFPVLIGRILIVMYLPLELKAKKKIKS